MRVIEGHFLALWIHTVIMLYYMKKLTRGYPHIIGANDSCIWPWTPLENLKTVLDLFKS